MAKRNEEASGKYPTYHQYAFRASAEEIELIKAGVDHLYAKFNRGRDSSDPKGRMAVKRGDIALEALKLGMESLKKRDQWKWSK